MPVPSDAIGSGRITAGLKDCSIRVRRAVSAVAWGRCHLVCHWLRYLLPLNTGSLVMPNLEQGRTMVSRLVIPALERESVSGHSCRGYDLSQVWIGRPGVYTQRWDQAKSQGLAISVDHETLGPLTLPGPLSARSPQQKAGEIEKTVTTHSPPPVLGSSTQALRNRLAKPNRSQSPACEGSHLRTTRLKATYLPGQDKSPGRRDPPPEAATAQGADRPRWHCHRPRQLARRSILGSVAVGGFDDARPRSGAAVGAVGNVFVDRTVRMRHDARMIWARRCR